MPTALSWRTEANGKVWIFDLRPDAAWHDDAPVTADDVNEFVPQSSWAYVKDIQRYGYSANGAMAMLDEADWKDHDGDGIREDRRAAVEYAGGRSGEIGKLVRFRGVWP